MSVYVSGHVDQTASRFGAIILKRLVIFTLAKVLSVPIQKGPQREYSLISRQSSKCVII